MLPLRKETPSGEGPPFLFFGSTISDKGMPLSLARTCPL